jgi:hypothetical protein
MGSGRKNGARADSLPRHDGGAFRGTKAAIVAERAPEQLASEGEKGTAPGVDPAVCRGSYPANNAHRTKPIYKNSENCMPCLARKMTTRAQTRLPLPILHRSLIIRMERAAKSSQLERFDPKTKPEQHRKCDAVYGETLAWAQQTQFNADPAMPKGLRNRAADNWRVLFAVADACSQEWGKAARDAAIELSRGQDEDDMGVRLLADIRVIFDRGFPQDRLSSALLVEQLNDLPDGLWCEWRGPKDDGAPRKLSQGSLAMMLAPFGIRPRTIWPARRGVLGKSAKGYKRAQFESAWASYCDEGGTPSQPRNIRYLHDR